MTISSNTKCLLDTNILVALAVETSPRHQLATGFFEVVFTKKILGVISSQNLLEFSAVLIRAYKIPSRKVADDVKNLISEEALEKIFPNSLTLEKFTGLLKQKINVHPSDLFLAATALANNIDTIVTDDADFLKVKEIKVYNPFKD